MFTISSRLASPSEDALERVSRFSHLASVTTRACPKCAPSPLLFPMRPKMRPSAHTIVNHMSHQKTQSLVLTSSRTAAIHAVQNSTPRPPPVSAPSPTPLIASPPPAKTPPSLPWRNRCSWQYQRCIPRPRRPSRRCPSQTTPATSPSTFLSAQHPLAHPLYTRALSMSSASLLAKAWIWAADAEQAPTWGGSLGTGSIERWDMAFSKTKYHGAELGCAGHESRLDKAYLDLGLGPFQRPNHASRCLHPAPCRCDAPHG
jgi:hypothetical protein